METKNILSGFTTNLSEEITELITTSENMRIERIISSGQSSPEGFWYDQDDNEFVLLLTGSVRIMFEDESVIHLNPGDYLTILAHKKHRVEYTSEKEMSIWLAVFYR